MTWELRVALRYLTARRKQAFISLISAVAVLGVAVGVMSVLIALGLMTGLQSEIRSRILGATAHISVFRTGTAAFEDVEAVVDEVRKVPGVAGAAPAVYGKVLLTSPTGAAAATLKGIVPAEERTVTDVVAKVREGSAAALGTDVAGAPAPILLGAALADSLNVATGDVVTLTSPRGRLSPVGLLPRVTRARVVGTVKTGLYEFDASWGYLSLGAARRLIDDEGRTTHVEVRLNDMFAVKAGAKAILARLGEGYVTTDWVEMNQALYSALWIEKVAVGTAIGLIVAVAALNIVATLVLMVMEKHKDIAILVSMGASRGSIMRVFMLQGTVIGLVGTATGGLLGAGACWALDRFRVVRVPESVYQIAWVPFRLLPAEASVVLAAALLVCFAATLYPARGAARLDPAEALRYE
ncbi:MAG TPA: ABC transporter permease [Vicinamibacteria bacterium]|nr:ABC transporter permease [Vicinamibacteria bacterium]